MKCWNSGAVRIQMTWTPLLSTASFVPNWKLLARLLNGNQPDSRGHRPAAPERYVHFCSPSNGSNIRITPRHLPRISAKVYEPTSTANLTPVSPPIAQAFFEVMASQVKPGSTQPNFNKGLQQSTILIRRRPANSIRARDLVSHTQAGCLAAINSREAKPKRNAWQKGASMYVELSMKRKSCNRIARGVERSARTR